MKKIDAIHSRFLQYDNQIIIYEGNFHLEIKQKKYFFNGELYMVFNPTLVIKLRGTITKGIFLTKEEKILLSIPGMLPVRVNIVLFKNGTYFEGDIHQISNAENPLMDSYILHVVNYVDFYGSVVKSNEEYYTGGLHLEIDGWNIEIQKRHDYKEKDTFNMLKKNHGYNITHIIEIKRIDGKTFKKFDISKIDDVLSWVFNISAGQHISMPIEVGILGKEVVYEGYHDQLISPYRVVTNWFPKRKGEVLKELFYKMYSKFDDEYERRVIKEVVHQYIEIMETRFLENKIIHSQIALEKISYLLLNQRLPQILSNTKFKRNTFKENLEIILKELTIDSELNNQYSFFKKDFDSVPHLLAQYRNHIAHPKPNPIFEKYSADEKYLVLELSLYYTEMLMLYLIGYDGIYFNRLKFPLWQGDYEELPWNIKSGTRS